MFYIFVDLNYNHDFVDLRHAILYQFSATNEFQ